MLITLIIMPLLPDMPDIKLFSYSGFMVTIQQIAIGLVTGFVLQMVFSVMLVGGQTIAYSMGLGFASMVDPATGIQVPVIAQVFVISASLIFLSVNGHLLAIELLIDSFTTLPIAMVGLSKADLWAIILWSSEMFAGGMLLALPIVATVLFINISFGVAARAAPQLQIFGIGFPITIMVGMILIWITVPHMVDTFAMFLENGFQFIKQVLRV
jgi:flagellar biosynthetic protein FliR